jgi:glycosyltransferase involved in cell wall biosynthesis
VTLVPRVAVCVPTRNRAGYLAHSLESILRQTRPPDLLVISDDGSTDDTQRVVAQFTERFRSAGVEVRAFRHDPPLGQEGNRRFCFQQGEAEYVAMLDDDDLWRPRFIEKLTGLLERTPDAAFASCGLETVGSSGEVDEAATAYEAEVSGRAGLTTGVYGNLLGLVVRRMSFMLQTTVFRRSALASIGFVPHGSATACDWAVFCELAMADVRAAYLAERLACYRVHDGPRSFRLGYARMNEVSQYLSSLPSRAATSRARRLLLVNAIDYHREYVMELGHAGKRREAIREAMIMARRYGPLSLGRRIVIHLPLVLLGADRLRRRRPLPPPRPVSRAEAPELVSGIESYCRERV